VAIVVGSVAEAHHSYGPADREQPIIHKKPAHKNYMTTSSWRYNIGTTDAALTCLIGRPVRLCPITVSGNGKQG
jgi:hypothetical protein